MSVSDHLRTASAVAVGVMMASVTVLAAGGLDLQAEAAAQDTSTTTLVPRLPTTAVVGDPAGPNDPPSAERPGAPVKTPPGPPTLGSSPGATSTPVPPSTSTPAVPDPYAWLDTVGSPDRTFLGVSTQNGTIEEARAFDVAAGRQSDVMMVSRSWADASADLAAVEEITAAGYLPMIAWEPWDHRVESTFDKRRGEQPAYALSTIIAGDHDELIEDWATELAAWGRPVAIRFAHEMNGYWYPWSESVNGNVAGQYVAAWRHVHDVFTGAGATNVRWVWSPNPTQSTLTPLAGLYPGDDYVDWLGVVGYLGNGIDPGVYVPTFDQLFGPTIAELRMLSDLPLVITELGATELGGRKAEWITHVVSQVVARADIIGLIWFEVDKETDWRIVSSPEATAAFATAVSDARVGADRP